MRFLGNYLFRYRALPFSYHDGNPLQPVGSPSKTVAPEPAKLGAVRWSCWKTPCDRQNLAALRDPTIPDALCSAQVRSSMYDHADSTSDDKLDICFCQFTDQVNQICGRIEA